MLVLMADFKHQTRGVYMHLLVVLLYNQVISMTATTLDVQIVEIRCFQWDTVDGCQEAYVPYHVHLLMMKSCWSLPVIQSKQTYASTLMFFLEEAAECFSRASGMGRSKSCTDDLPQKGMPLTSCSYACAPELGGFALATIVVHGGPSCCTGNGG